MIDHWEGGTGVTHRSAGDGRKAETILKVVGAHTVVLARRHGDQVTEGDQTAAESQMVGAKITDGVHKPGSLKAAGTHHYVCVRNLTGCKTIGHAGTIPQAGKTVEQGDREAIPWGIETGQRVRCRL